MELEAIARVYGSWLAENRETLKKHLPTDDLREFFARVDSNDLEHHALHASYIGRARDVAARYGVDAFGAGMSFMHLARVAAEKRLEELRANVGAPQPKKPWEN